MSTTPRWALALAAGATGTALCLSVIAGWQRGGSLPERVVWVAIGVVLILGAHLIPTLIRGSPLVTQIVGSVLWGACMVTACAGYVTFFLFAQQHAGEARASGLTTVLAGPSVSAAPAQRTLTAVMEERAMVTHQLALARAQRCARDCAFLDVRRVTLAARLDALDAEAADIRRRHAEDDFATTRREALLADPVTLRLAALLGMPTARVDLLTGVLFATVLEGLACLLWTVALRPSSRASAVPVVAGPRSQVIPPVPAMTDVTRPPVTSVTQNPDGEPVSRDSVARSHGNPTGRHTPCDDPLTVAGATDDDLTQLAHEVAAGLVRATVVDIRRHLKCSQARAAALRRQLADLTA
jgi:hypothetical protein